MQETFSFTHTASIYCAFFFNYKLFMYNKTNFSAFTLKQDNSDGDL